MSTHNICFHGELRKLFIYIQLLPAAKGEWTHLETSAVILQRDTNFCIQEFVSLLLEYFWKRKLLKGKNFLLERGDIFL